MNRYIKYYIGNFGLMFCGCLIVDTITYLTRGTTDILASAIIAAIAAVVFTTIYYLRNKYKDENSN